MIARTATSPGVLNSGAVSGAYCAQPPQTAVDKRNRHGESEPPTAGIFGGAAIA